MKKSTGVILVLIIVLLLGVIGVGSYFFVKENNDTNKEIGDLKNEVANLGKNAEKTSNNYTMNNVQTNNITTSTNTQTSENTINTTESNNTSVHATNSENVLYTYSSGDNAAAHGNGELLYVYEINDNIIKFKYHTPWNENDISGIATKINGDLYAYQKENYKIEILLNSMGENSLKVTEYENGSETSWKNLWR